MQEQNILQSDYAQYPFNMLLSIVWFAALAATAVAQSLQQVTNFGTNPTNIRMFIHVPTGLPASPAIIVAVCYCPLLIGLARTTY